MISDRPQHIQIENRLLRPLVSPESIGRISNLGVAHQTIWKEIDRAKAALYPETPKAFNVVKKEVYGAYDTQRPRYGFTVKAADIVQRPHLRGHFSLDF